MKKNIIITGGARGIGEAIVRTLAEEGHSIFLNYNKSETQANILVQDIRKKGGEVVAYKADISDINQGKEMCEYAISKFNKIDVLINNAGISQFKLFTDITENDWDSIINTNLKSALFISKEIAKNMIHYKSGLILNISSIWGITGASCEVLYSISKSGLDGMTKALAKELAPSNIRVNSIAPGAIDTDMNKDVLKEKIEEEIPLGRMGKPEDIAKCVKWLVEDNYTTGQIISPNGGWVI